MEGKLFNFCYFKKWVKNMLLLGDFEASGKFCHHVLECANERLIKIVLSTFLVQSTK